MSLKKYILILLSAVSLTGLASCSYIHSYLGLIPGSWEKQAFAVINGRSGTLTKGKVYFIVIGNDVIVKAQITGLKPNSEYGFHIHEKGDCFSYDASSAGGHFNPDAKMHGAPNSDMHHAGDMPNMKSDANGKAVYTAKLQHGFKLDASPNGIRRRAVVIHRDPDDYKSQPAGNSGPGIACGLIREQYYSSNKDPLDVFN